MSQTVNEVTLIGNVGRDPEDLSKNEMKKARIVVATSFGGYTKKDGSEVKEETEWHDIIVFGKEADFALNYVKKGNTVYVSGRLRSYTTESEGKKMKHWNVVAEKVINLTKGGTAPVSTTPPPPPQPVWNAATNQWEIR